MNQSETRPLPSASVDDQAALLKAQNDVESTSSSDAVAVNGCHRAKSTRWPREWSNSEDDVDDPDRTPFLRSHKVKQRERERRSCTLHSRKSYKEWSSSEEDASSSSSSSSEDIQFIRRKQRSRKYRRIILLKEPKKESATKEWGEVETITIKEEAVDKHETKKARRVVEDEGRTGEITAKAEKKTPVGNAIGAEKTEESKATGSPSKESDEDANLVLQFSSDSDDDVSFVREIQKDCTSFESFIKDFKVDDAPNFNILMNQVKFSELDDNWSVEMDKVLMQYVLMNLEKIDCCETLHKLIKESKSILQDVSAKSLNLRIQYLVNASQYWYFILICGGDNIQTELQRKLFLMKLEKLRNILKTIVKQHYMYDI